MTRYITCEKLKLRVVLYWLSFEALDCKMLLQTCFFSTPLHFWSSWLTLLSEAIVVFCMKGLAARLHVYFYVITIILSHSYFIILILYVLWLLIIIYLIFYLKSLFVLWPLCSMFQSRSGHTWPFTYNTFMCFCPKRLKLMHLTAIRTKN